MIAPRKPKPPTCSGVYQIVNRVNQKRYVGSAKNLRARRSAHVSQLQLGKHGRHIQASWKKHGPEAFSFEILLFCSEDNLLFYEQRAIDTLKPEYNLARIAGNTAGVVCTEERKRKISAANTGRKLSREHKERIGAAAKGKKHSPETMVLLFNLAQERARDPEWRRKVSEGKTGVPMSEAHKQNLSRAKKGVPANLSEESRLRKNQKIAAANRVRTITDQHRANAAKGQRERKGVERFEYEGQQWTVLALAERFGLCRHVLRKRINMGWALEDALTRPARKLK